MCRGYFSSQEIDSHDATEHRSTDQSRNGCGMCCFCHAQPFEITRAKNIKNTLWQHSSQNAKVVEAFSRSRRVHHRDRHQHTIPIALAALPGAILPRLRALVLFGRRPSECVERPSFRRPKTCTPADVHPMPNGTKSSARVQPIIIGSAIQAPKRGPNLDAGRGCLLADAAASLKISVSDLVE